MDSLNRLINIFDDYDRHEFDDQMALEVHSMKEHIFNILGRYSTINVTVFTINQWSSG